MTLENVNPGEDFNPSASAWNAAMGVARAYQAGELQGLTPRLPILSQQTVIKVKNNSGTAIARFQIVNLDVAVFGSDDNENDYKNNGPSIKIDGPPKSGREAFIGVLPGPIAGNTPGEVVVGGPVVAYVRGTGKYAWPKADDSDAFETNNTGGFPIFDRGDEGEDGKRIAYLLLTSRTASPSNNDGGSTGGGGLPEATPSCGCNGCVEGTQQHACGDCGCVNRRRGTRLPSVTPNWGLEEVWAELSTISDVWYFQDCIWRSKEINGPACGDGPRDKYRFFCDYASGEAWIERTDGEYCPEIRLRWCMTSTCTKKCLCPWRFTLASDGWDNVYPPAECDICVSPIMRKPPKDMQEVALCGDDNCVLEFDFSSSLEISGTGLAIPMAIGGGDQPVNKLSFDGTYLLDRDHVLDGECCEVGELCVRWGSDEAWVPIPAFFMPEEGVDVYNYEWMPGAAIFGVGDNYVIWAAMHLRGTIVFPDDGGSYTEESTCYLAWVSEEMTCEQLKTVVEAGEITLSPYCPNSSQWCQQPGSATFRFSGLVQKKAGTTGYPGSTCGAEDPCVTAECVREVVIVGGVKVYVESDESTCDECGSCSGTPCNPFTDDECGNADTHDEGYLCRKPCLPEAELPETVELTFSEYMVSCPCGASSMQLCLDEGDGHYRGSNVLCGAGHSWEYYEDGGLWYLVRDGAATASSADPAGPFLFGEVPGGDPCGSLAVTVS